MHSQVWHRWGGFLGLIVEKVVSFVVLLIQLGFQ